MSPDTEKVVFTGEFPLPIFCAAVVLPNEGVFPYSNQVEVLLLFGLIEPFSMAELEVTADALPVFTVGIELCAGGCWVFVLLTCALKVT